MYTFHSFVHDVLKLGEDKVENGQNIFGKFSIEASLTIWVILILPRCGRPLNAPIFLCIVYMRQIYQVICTPQRRQVQNAGHRSQYHMDICSQYHRGICSQYHMGIVSSIIGVLWVRIKGRVRMGRIRIN